MSSDRRPSSDPELTRLQDLARRGRGELGALPSDRASQLWPAIAEEAFDRQQDDRGAGDGGSGSGLQWMPLALVAALALVVGVGLGALVIGRVPGTPQATVLATVELAALQDDVGVATARLHDDGETRTVQLDLDGLPRTDGFHEVWLLDPGSGALVSLGPVRPDATYVVPDAVDLVDLSVLDVSAEPRDGDPGHSGDSLLRGELRWTG